MVSSSPTHWLASSRVRVVHLVSQAVRRTCTLLLGLIAICGAVEQSDAILVDLRSDVEVATKGGPMVRGGQYIEIPLQKVAVRLPHIIVRTAPQRMYVERSRAATLLV